MHQAGGWKTNLSIGVGLLAIGAMSWPAWAGIVIGARRSEDMPRLVLNVNGPSGVIRSLGFSADSRRLFAGGMDKAVHGWEVLSGPVQGAIKAAPVKTLRWEIARGLRGVVYTTAVSPADNRVAIGGFNARSQAGTVVVYDQAKGDVDAALADHSQPVVGMAFSADGKFLATCSRDGELRVTSVGDWKSQQLRPPANEGFFPRPIAFVGSRTVVTTAPTHAEQNRIHVYSLADGQWTFRVLEEKSPVQIIALTGDKAGGQIVSADAAGNLLRWELSAGAKPRLLGSGLAASSLAIGSDGTLFVATLFAHPKKRGGRLLAYRLADGELLDEFITSETSENLAVCVSPDGRMAACCGPTALDVLIFPLVDDNGKPFAKPLSGGREVVVRHRGQIPLKVAFSEQGPYRLGYGFKPAASSRNNDLGRIERFFDYSTFEHLPMPEQPQWRSPELQGWEIAFDQQRRQIRISRAGMEVGTVTMNPATQERIYSYCWLTDEKGQPYAIAVGTDVQFGIYVHGVAEAGEWPLLRYFRDHSEWVTSLSMSPDGRFLASASADLTIKLWSLEGLRTGAGAQRAIVRQGRGFTKQLGWGANFEIRNNGVVITSISPAGIAEQRGLRAGDVVAEAEFGTSAAKAMNRTGPSFVARQAEEILAGLEATPLHEQVLLTIRRLGRTMPQQFLLVPAWEPVMTFFADDRGEWACWTPQGYYQASVHGDELFGWQINRGSGTKPDFYRADQFRGDLEKPEMMKQLLARGSTRAALVAVNHSVPEVLDAVIGKAADSVALVTIVDPPDGQSAVEKGVRIVAKIGYRDGRPVGDTSAKAYINGVPIAARQVSKSEDSATVEWNVTPPDPFSRVRVVAARESQGASGNFSFADVHVRSINLQRKPRLHAVAMAAGEYPGALKLDFPVADAEAVIERLWVGKQGIYEAGFTRKLYNKDVSRDSVNRMIESVRSELGNAPSGDLLVVFLAGHGVAFGNDYYFIPPDSRLTNLDPAKAESLIKEIGVSWTQLRQLAALPCRKVFFLDTCFAGNTLLADGTSRHMKTAIRPLSRDEVLVLAATAENQSALESARLGHGVFTKCLLDGLNGNAARKGIPEIDLGGVSSYLETAVPELTQSRQTPRSSPTELLDLLFIPLVRNAATPQVESFKLR